MDKNKILIIALIAVIAVLILGLAIAMPNFGKEKVNVTVKSNDTISQGESIEIELTDVNGTPIENETVNVTLKDENGTEDVKVAVITDDEGIAEVEVDEDQEVGNYTVECTFEGNDNFTENTTTQEIEIVEEVVEETVDDTSEDIDYGAFYSEQAGRVIYTGEVHEGPDGHRYRHLGYNEWELVD
ncbi:hypothetical protein [uncultured Methanobrevibacter sp.]|uniref:hypothetical protein n=1 Tax=uncultured Methanobrevibacter sp. TaxID=253161 RepID=UPI00263737C0|nr:hypothetical protein [uncultured Methanobrevibacter sp.]